MFYQEIKTAWQDGKVRVGLPALGHGTDVTVEASGLLGVKTKFLSSAEKKLLANAAKDEANRVAGLALGVGSNSSISGLVAKQPK